MGDSTPSYDQRGKVKAQKRAPTPLRIDIIFHLPPHPYFDSGKIVWTTLVGISNRIYAHPISLISGF